MKKIYFISFLFLTVSFSAFSQGLIINEINQGASGNKEFIELLVVGSTGQTTGNVNLQGWVIDDNNGEFQAGTGSGVANGHIRIVNGFLTAVPIGSIILIYNSADLYAGLPANDLTDANADGVYVIPSNYAGIEVCTTAPTTTSTAYTGCSYTAGSLTAWGTISMANGGDVAQVRRPDFSFYDGFSFGSVSAATVRPTFPVSGTPSFNPNPSAGTASGNVALQCGNFYAAPNYTATTAGAGTPGAANSTLNGNLISSLRNGTFNYSQLTNLTVTCSVLLPVEITDFNLRIIEKGININAKIITDNSLESIELQKSEDGFNFISIEKVENADKSTSVEINFIDENPFFPVSYYRLKLLDKTGSDKYSKVISASIGKKETSIESIFPLPTRDLINIRIHSNTNSTLNATIIDVYGKIVAQEIWKSDVGTRTYTLQTDRLSNGVYFIRIQLNGAVLVKKISKL